MADLLGPFPVGALYYHFVVSLIKLWFAAHHSSIWFTSLFFEAAGPRTLGTKGGETL